MKKIIPTILFLVIILTLPTGTPEDLLTIPIWQAIGTKTALIIGLVALILYEELE